MFKNDFDISQINLTKLIRTIRGSIKKAIFYLDAKVPYSFSENLIKISGSEFGNYLSGDGQKIKYLVILDAKIRHCDDILDNKLSRQTPKPIKEMHKVIDRFDKEVPEAKEVAKLFRLELSIFEEKNNTNQLKKKIRDIIDVRPSDYFVLIEKIVKIFGTGLNKNDYRQAWDFYLNFQRLRDLLDDMMSVEEDILKNDYNSIVIAKNKGIKYQFFDDIIMELFSKMEKSLSKIKKHPHRDIFQETMDFWTKQYKILFKTLLVNYYIDLEEFKKSYFMIKQL